MPWRTIAVSMALLTAALLGTLAIVVAKTDGDPLATTALALALLSFIAQLMIALTQFTAAARQQEENTRITSDTRAALSTILSVADGLSRAMQGQLDRLLDYALKDVREQAETPEEVEAADRLVERVREDRLDRLPIAATADAVTASQQLAIKLTQFLESSGLPAASPPIASSADVVWVGPDDRLRVALVKAPASPHFAHRGAIERYARQANRASHVLGGDDAVPVVVLPFEPKVRDWVEIEQESGVLFVWPETFNRAL